MANNKGLLIGGLALAGTLVGAVYLMRRAQGAPGTITTPAPQHPGTPPQPVPQPTPQPPRQPTPQPAPQPVPQPVPQPTTQPPSQAPSGVTVQGLSPTSVLVSWLAVPGATHYQVIHPAWRDAQGNLHPEEIVAVTASTSMAITGLARNSPYSVWVQACNSAGCGPRSALASGSTLP